MRLFTENKLLKKMMILLFWLVLWQLITMVIHNNILLTGPVETLLRWLELLRTVVFWKSCLYSTVKILAGFVGAVLAGGILAYLSYRMMWIEELLKPFLTLLKNVPVASFVVLFLILFKNDFLSTAIVFVVGVPMIYFPCLEEFRTLRTQFEEVWKVFQIPLVNRIFYMIIPHSIGSLGTALFLTLGMSFKSGVAAEIIGTPSQSMGLQMYMAKVSLDTATLFSYTITIILLGYGCEKALEGFLKFLENLHPKCKASELMSDKQKTVEKIECLSVSKSYHQKQILKGDYVFEAKEPCILNWPSGMGKTTLLHMLAGLITSDEGRKIYQGNVALLFQEDRLLMKESALNNIYVVSGDLKKAMEHLSEVLPGEDVDKTVQEYSGGMRRRVALVRAMITNAPLVLLDEPFAGLDEDCRELVWTYIKKHLNGRICIIADHLA